MAWDDYRDFLFSGFLLKFLTCLRNPGREAVGILLGLGLPTLSAGRPSAGPQRSMKFQKAENGVISAMWTRMNNRLENLGILNNPPTSQGTLVYSFNSFWKSHKFTNSHFQQSNSNLQVFGKARPLLDHRLDRGLLWLAWRPQKLSVVLEDAGKVVCVCHQLPAHVRRIEESAKGEVIAARGKKISVCWGHLAVVFWHLLVNFDAKWAASSITWKAGLAKVESVWRSVIASWLSSRVPDQDLGLAKGEEGLTCPGRNLSEASLSMSPFQDQLQELSPRMTCCRPSWKHPPKGFWQPTRWHRRGWSLHLWSAPWIPCVILVGSFRMGMFGLLLKREYQY